MLTPNSSRPYQAAAFSASPLGQDCLVISKTAFRRIAASAKRKVQAHNAGRDSLPTRITRNVLPQITPQPKNASSGKEGRFTIRSYQSLSGAEQYRSRVVKDN